MKSFSRVRLFVTPWTVACQAPLSIGFSRQEYWSGLPFLLQEIFPTQGSNPGLPHCRQTLYHLSHQGRALINVATLILLLVVDAKLLSDCRQLPVLHPLLEKAMASHSSTLAWKILWTEEPGGLQSMGFRSRTRLFTFHPHALEKEMATHSSVFARRIPGMGKPGGLPSMVSHRVGHD